MKRNFFAFLCAMLCVVAPFSCSDDDEIQDPKEETPTTPEKVNRLDTLNPSPYKRLVREDIIYHRQPGLQTFFEFQYDEKGTMTVFCWEHDEEKIIQDGNKIILNYTQYDLDFLGYKVQSYYKYNYGSFTRSFFYNENKELSKEYILEWFNQFEEAHNNQDTAYFTWEEGDLTQINLVDYGAHYDHSHVTNTYTREESLRIAYTDDQNSSPIPNKGDLAIDDLNNSNYLRLKIMPCYFKNRGMVTRHLPLRMEGCFYRNKINATFSWELDEDGYPAKMTINDNGEIETHQYTWR